MPGKTCIRPAKLVPYLVVMPLELIGAMWWPTVGGYPPFGKKPNYFPFVFLKASLIHAWDKFYEIDRLVEGREGGLQI